MTNEQWQGVLLMVRGMALKCDKASEVVEFIDDVLEGKQPRKKKADEE